jgi:hypothetical protein
MPRRAPSIPRITALAAVAALALVAAGVVSLSRTPWEAVPALAAHAVHLVAAFAAGRAALRLPRAAPREALDVVVSALAPGLAVMALLSLTFATLGLARPWTPWVIDSICLVLGLLFGRLREAIERVAEPWLRRDMAVLAAPRLPLYVAVSVLALMHVIPPLVPPSEATGARALALPAQVAARGSLEAGLAAQPHHDAMPSSALLLQGQLTGGDVGARLFGLTLLGLAVAATWLHARRHLGERAAAWSCICLLSVPWLVDRAPRDPSFEMLLAFGVLAFHEIADWCQHATGGKIGLASLYGGVLVAEGAQGAAVLVSLLAFLFLVQALVDRHGVFAQIGGIGGMALLALLIASPFVALSASRSADPLASLSRRYLVSSQDASADVAHGIGEGVDLRDADSVPLLLAELARRALLAGPLMLGLLALLPAIPLPAEPLRRGVLAGLVAAAAGLAPAPYGGVAGVLGPAAFAAGGVAALLLRQRGLVATASAAFAVPALLATVLLALARGPDLALGARYLSGRIDRDAYLSLTVPDAALARAVEEHRDDDTDVVLVGDLTDVLYGRARRVADEALHAEIGSRLLVAAAPTGDPHRRAELSTYAIVDDAGNGYRLLVPSSAN